MRKNEIGTTTISSANLIKLERCKKAERFQFEWERKVGKEISDCRISVEMESKTTIKSCYAKNTKKECIETTDRNRCHRIQRNLCAWTKKIHKQCHNSIKTNPFSIFEKISYSSAIQYPFNYNIHSTTISINKLQWGIIVPISRDRFVMLWIAKPTFTFACLLSLFNPTVFP